MRLFTQHPQAVGETYFEHMGVASHFGWRMTVAGLACFVHALFPFFCVKTGSNTIRALHHDMVTHRQRKAPAEAEIGAYLGDAI